MDNLILPRLTNLSNTLTPIPSITKSISLFDNIISFFKDNLVLLSLFLLITIVLIYRYYTNQKEEPQLINDFVLKDYLIKQSELKDEEEEEIPVSKKVSFNLSKEKSEDEKIEIEKSLQKEESEDILSENFIAYNDTESFGNF